MNTLALLIPVLVFAALVAVGGRALFRRLVAAQMRRASPTARAGGPSPRHFAVATAGTGAAVLFAGVFVGLVIFPALWEPTPEMRAQEFLSGLAEGELDRAAELMHEPEAGAARALRDSLRGVRAYSELEATEEAEASTTLSATAQEGEAELALELDMRRDEGAWRVAAVRLGGDELFGDGEVSPRRAEAGGESE